MQLLAEAFHRNWFYVGALVVGTTYGLGGVVHVSSMLGFGEVRWSEAPLAWKVGDIWWGALDIAAVVGIVLKSPYGLLALALAAGSQIVAYGLAPDSFALTASHRATLRGLLYFNAVVLAVLGAAVYAATRDSGT